MFRIAKYARRDFAIWTLAAGVVGGVSVWAALRIGWGFWACAAVVAALWSGVAWFLRDPQRHPPQDPTGLLCPADGRVTDITPVGPESPLGRDGLKIGVFMTLLSCHVNRSPADGRVQRVEHRPGRFLDARSENAGQLNESADVHLIVSGQGREYPIVVRQIAGLVARRIVTDLAAGQSLVRGQRIGMIKFGSRVELLVPDELLGTVRVEVGQPVRAGESVLVTVRCQDAGARGSHDPA